MQTDCREGKLCEFQQSIVLIAETGIEIICNDNHVTQIVTDDVQLTSLLPRVFKQAVCQTMSQWYLQGSLMKKSYHSHFRLFLQITFFGYLSLWLTPERL